MERRPRISNCGMGSHAEILFFSPFLMVEFFLFAEVLHPGESAVLR